MNRPTAPAIMISADTLATLAMLRRAYPPDAGAAPTKRPPGGRPNPCAAVKLSEARRYAQVPRSRRARGWADTDLAARFVAAVERGDIPAGVPLRGAEMRRHIGNGKTFQGGWENLSATLAANRMPVRLRALTPHGTRKQARYRVEFV